MSADILLNYFNRISEASDAIPRFRRFILDLAVRGKLVEQNSNDEPATELFARIKVEKENARFLQRVKTTKKGKPQDIDNPVSFAPSHEIPFPIPSNWQWSDLGSISIKTGSGHTPRGGKSVYKASGVPFLRSQNIYNEGLRLNNVAYIDDPTHEKMSGTAVQPGDLLLNITGGSIGRCCCVPNSVIKANISQHVAIIRLTIHELCDFVHWVVLSPFFQSFILNEQTGAGREGLPKNRMDRIPIALPPLAEQDRIVAKVDELMALCDQLQTAKKERETKRDRLVASSLNRIITTKGDEAKYATLFHLNQISRLTTRPEHIKQLRQTILNLAVQGRLVPQDVNDEPSVELLKKIQTEKLRLVKEGKIRKQQDLGPIRQEEQIFDLPKHWMWVRLGYVIHLVSGQHLKPHEYSDDSRTGVPYITGPSDFGQNGLMITRYALVLKAIAYKGQLLLTVKGSGVGKTTICDLTEVAISRQLMAMAAIEWNSQFMELITHRLAESLRHCARSLIPGIAREDVDEFVIAMPPLAEQNRIVAKVDELMALCDKLETQLTTTETDSRHLLEAVLSKALDTRQI
jgi:type I restriction enzyme S subunit